VNNTKITFVPKTCEERLAFNQRADDLKKIADQQEARLRKEVLPTYDAYPFESPVEHDDIVIERVMMPMRDNICLRSYAVRSLEGLNIWHFNHYMGDRHAIETRDDVLVYTTAVLQDDVEVTGIIEATLYAASSAPDTDFMVNLIDVYPDGHTQFLTHGVMRVTYREGLHERKLIEPGRIYKYEFKLQPIGVKFQKGHRMRVEITSSEMDKYARNQNVADAPGTTANVAIAHQTIYHGREYPSKLVLPMIPSSGFYDFGKGY